MHNKANKQYKTTILEPKTKMPNIIVSDMNSILNFAYHIISSNSQEWSFKYNLLLLDIDDTCLSSKDQQQKNILRPVSPLVYSLYLLCKSLGWHVAFITARIHTEQNEKTTVKQLLEMGFRWSHLFLMPENYMHTDPNYSRYKRNARLQLASMGYIIGLSIGDSWADHLLLEPIKYTEISKEEQKQHILAYASNYMPNSAVAIFDFDLVKLSIKMPDAVY